MSHHHRKKSASDKPLISDKVRAHAFRILAENPHGVRFSELHRQICHSDAELNPSTVNSSMWNLDVTCPSIVYKPSRGMFRLVTFRDSERPDQGEQATTPVQSRYREDVFYPLFASWLKDELEEVTKAIPLGGSVFRDKWGSPDVLGVSEGLRSDLIKGPTTIVAAEIKSDTNSLLIGFGQACAYKLFSHKVYLVIPQDVSPDDLARLDSLCQIFGLGLVTFNSKDALEPNFQLICRAMKHEPDLFYSNRNLRHVEKELFS